MMPAKQRIEIIITLILIVILIFSWGNMQKVFERKRQLVPLSSQSDSAILSGEENPSAFQQQAPQRQVWGRCPFSGKVYTDLETGAEIRLLGIVWDVEAPVAMINDSIVKAGDKIGKYTIREIKQDKVIVSDGITTFELSL
jgi:type II secretory pathway component PulC